MEKAAHYSGESQKNLHFSSSSLCQKNANFRVEGTSQLASLYLTIALSSMDEIISALQAMQPGNQCKIKKYANHCQLDVFSSLCW